MLPAALTGRRAAGRRWAPGRTDAWLAGALAVASAGLVLAIPAAEPYRPVDVVAVLLAVVAPVGLLWRQVAPLGAIVISGAVVVANAAAGYAIGPVQFPVWFALFGCYAAGGLRVRAVASGIVVAAAVGYEVLDRGDPTGDLPGIMISFLIATVAGDLSSRRVRAAAAQARSAAESRQQALAAERLLLQERGRLARELHDSLGHTVNVMVLQAGVGRRVFAENAGYAREALTAIETVGRGALEELDRLLRVLQPDERKGRAQPFAPTIADLEELAQRIRATGRQVELLTDGVELTESGARAVYRIIQEALTNAVRHSSAGRIRVRVWQTQDRVLLDVLNEGGDFDPPVPGRGLVNMRERARLEGGDVEAGPVENGFRVYAVLPATSAARR